MEKTADVRVSKARLKMLEGRAYDCKRAEAEYAREKRRREDLQRENRALETTLEDALAVIETREPALGKVLRSLVDLRLRQF